MKDRVGQNRVFVSFDIDVIDPVYAPGTGTPEVGGFISAETIDLIRGFNRLDYVGFDVVEVLPDYDVAEITALLAANVVYEFLSLIALNKSWVEGLTIRVDKSQMSEGEEPPAGGSQFNRKRNW